MSELKRYGFDYRGDELEKDDGKYVKYTDAKDLMIINEHLQKQLDLTSTHKVVEVIDKLQKRVEELEAQLEDKDSEIFPWG